MAIWTAVAEVAKKALTVAEGAVESVARSLGLEEQALGIRAVGAEGLAAKVAAQLTEARVASMAEINQKEGKVRQDAVVKELQERFPESEGFRVLTEVTLRDKDGYTVKDPESGCTRRVDCVVIKDGVVHLSVEVTSPTAPKALQAAKEERIRAAGGNFILDKATGKLHEISATLKTEIWRRK